MAKLPEIPSEFIQPYLVKYFNTIIESVGMGFETPVEAKSKLYGVECFVSMFCGINSRIACSNEYYKIKNLSDEDFKALCVRIVKTCICD